MQALPIDRHIPKVLEQLQTHNSLVLLAPPGTGKTTRVPRALYENLKGEVIVLQPRRVAAKLSAERVASEMNHSVGELVGYQFRFENKTSSQTRVRYMTEGTFTRRLLKDQKLQGVAAVVLDEFHERHLHTDFAISALRAIQSSLRPDLKILVMSATIDPQPIADFLGGCPVYTVETPIFPLEISYENTNKDWLKDLRKAVSDLLREPVALERSDILVFLPGQREIENAARALAELEKNGFQILRFYSSAPVEEQKKAILSEGPRKIVLATNIAETSITIEGVKCVIDSGLAKVPSFSWWAGLPQLKLQKISKASAIQRAGRAARTGPGKCVRLYARQDFDSRQSFEVPEILRSDLSTTLLELLELDLKNFEWFEKPPTNLLAASENLLKLIHAVHNGGITDLGRQLASLPLHPRLATMVMFGVQQGAGDRAALLAALLSTGDFEGEDLLESLHRAENSQRFSRTTDQALRQIRSALNLTSKSSNKSDDVLAQSILRGFPDRVGKRAGDDPLTLNLCGGGSVTLSDRALADSAEYFVLPELDEMVTAKGKKLVVRAAVGIEPEWLIDLDTDILKEERSVRWNSGRGRVEEVALVRYDQLTLSESVQEPSDRKEAAQILLKAFKSEHGDRWVTALEGGEEIASLVSRITFAKSRKSLPSKLMELLKEDWNLDHLLESFVLDSFTKLSLKEFQEHNFKDYLLYGAFAEFFRVLDDCVPDSIHLGKRRAKINYPENQSPWVESRIQDFFGMRETPKVLGEPLTLHLLAPNYRAVQVTQDLSGFWEREYPKLRVELGRRYPRHKWPENPLE